MGNGDHVSTTELDSHANMPVVGCHTTTIQHTGLHAEVHGFADGLKMEKVAIVDAAIAYDDPYSLKTYIIIIKNALHVPSMSHNLIPPFIMREAGLIINEEPKCQANAPSIDALE